MFSRLSWCVRMVACMPPGTLYIVDARGAIPMVRRETESRAKRQSSELFFTCRGCCECFQGDTVDYVARTICGLCAKSNYEKSMITFDNGTPISQDFVALAGYAACELEENSIHDFRCIPCSEKEGQTDLGLIDNPAGEGVMIICRCQKSNGGKARHRPKRPPKKK